MSTQADSRWSRHFRLERLTDGVYAEFHLDGGWAISNSGIVDLGERTLVFDTSLTPHAARDLRAAAEALTGRVPNYVVNSHYHNDHIRGNQIFPEAVVLSTTRTLELIATKEYDELEADRKQAPERLASMKILAQSENLEDQRTAAFWVPYYEGILASFPEVQLSLPELTFKNQLTFHGTARTAELIEFGGGHTESDCVLFLPKEGVLFCGDLLFVRGHPYLLDGSPEAWLSILKQLANLAADVYVPGHGPLGKSEDLDKMRLYIHTLMQQVQETAAQGKTLEDAVKQPVPEPFTDWILAKPFYEANMRFLYDRLVQR